MFGTTFFCVFFAQSMLQLCVSVVLNGIVGVLLNHGHTMCN